MTCTVDFIHGLRWQDIPESAKRAALRALADTLGVAANGSRTELSRIIRNHAATQFGAGTECAATLWFDGRKVSPVGAALANGMTIDAIDAHDGHKLTKGHVGCGVLPALIAMSEATGLHDPHEFLTALVMGYEIGTRAGIALHDTAADYHTSGAWIALAAAAIGARLLQLGRDRTREALGIAEYHGPRSQMMRCIDHPTMVKDGSGWGAMAGISAAYLARDGFTGAPAITVQQPETEAIWRDLGTHWRVEEQYFKLYPVCRWAQPAVEAVLALKAGHGFDVSDIERIEIVTFDEAARLATVHPRTTEEAQYALPHPVAVALLRGAIGFDEISGEALEDRRIAALRERIGLRSEARYNDAFPGRRFAHAKIYLKSGELLEGPATEAIGDPENPVDDATVERKFLQMAGARLSPDDAQTWWRALQNMATGTSTNDALAPLVTVPESRFDG